MKLIERKVTKVMELEGEVVKRVEKEGTQKLK